MDPTNHNIHGGGSVCDKTYEIPTQFLIKTRERHCPLIPSKQEKVSLRSRSGEQQSTCVSLHLRLLTLAETERESSYATIEPATKDKDEPRWLTRKNLSITIIIWMMISNHRNKLVVHWNHHPRPNNTQMKKRNRPKSQWKT